MDRQEEANRSMVSKVETKDQWEFVSNKAHNQGCPVSCIFSEIFTVILIFIFYTFVFFIENLRLQKRNDVI